LFLKQFITDEEEQEYSRLYSLTNETFINIFEKHGFVYNVDNSLDKYGCNKKSLAFEKNELKCRLLFEPNETKDFINYLPTISIKCSEGISTVLANQKEALQKLQNKDYYISRYYYDGINKCKRIILEVAPFSSCGSHGVEFVNFGGTWVNLGEGHEGPTCEELSSKNIPAECFNYNCWSEKLKKDVKYDSFLKQSK